MLGSDEHPKGLPLRQAVVRYQFPSPDDDPTLSPSALVQHFCDIAVGFESPFRFRFHPEECLFDIVAEVDLGNDLAERIQVHGQFYIGDDGPFMFDLSEDGPFVEDVRSKIQTLHRLLEMSLHAPWNAERLRVYGRLSSPLAVVGLIAPDSLGLFTVVDWDKSIVEFGATRIYAVRVELIQYPQRPSEAPAPILGLAPAPIESLPDCPDPEPTELIRSDKIIHDTLLEIHRLAHSHKIASPNTNEMPRFVNRILARRNATAPVGKIRKLAAHSRYDPYELGVGVSAKSKGLLPATELEKLLNLGE
jgi:hypothetical protein